MTTKIKTIPFSKVVDLIKNYSTAPDLKKPFHPRIWELIEGCESFSNHYCKHPVGFAETDRLEDADRCLHFIRNLNVNLWFADFDKELNQVCKAELDQQRTRFAEGKNSSQLGRYVGRLHYIMSKVETELDKLYENSKKK